MILEKLPIIGFFIEAILYGTELVLLIGTLYLLQGLGRNTRWLLHFFSVLSIFALSTTHISASLCGLIEGFVGPSANPAVYFVAPFTVTYRLKMACIVFQVPFLDGLIAHRCYMIWDRKRFVLFAPLLTFSGYSVSISVCLAGGFMMSTKGWLSAILCITLAIKPIYLVLLLFGSFSPRERSECQGQMKSKGYDVAQKVLLISVESGILATIALFISVPMYMNNNLSQEVLLDIVSPLIGVSYFLILLLSLLGLTPASTPLLRTGRLAGLLDNQPRLPPIKISVDIEAYDSQTVFSTAGQKGA